MASERLKKKHEEQTVVSRLDLRSTRMRECVITLFNENPGKAFSESDIRQVLPIMCDRVTLYRTIKTLLSKVFIHKIVCENGVLKYALNESKTDLEPHVHFQCTHCNSVFCLSNYAISIPPLPNGLRANEYHFLIKGSCNQHDTCKSKKIDYAT